MDFEKENKKNDAVNIVKKIRQTATLPKTLKKIRSLPCTPTITFMCITLLPRKSLGRLSF